MKFAFALLSLALVAAVSGKPAADADFSELANHAEKLFKETKSMMKEIESGSNPERKELLSDWKYLDWSTLECAMESGGCATQMQNAEGKADLRETIEKVEGEKDLYNALFKGEGEAKSTQETLKEKAKAILEDAKSKGVTNEETDNGIECVERVLRLMEEDGYKYDMLDGKILFQGMQRINQVTGFY